MPVAQPDHLRLTTAVLEVGRDLLRGHALPVLVLSRRLIAGEAALLLLGVDLSLLVLLALVEIERGRGLLVFALRLGLLLGGGLVLVAAAGDRRLVLLSQVRRLAAAVAHFAEVGTASLDAAADELAGLALEVRVERQVHDPH